MAQASPFSVTVHPYPSATPGTCAYESGDTSAKNAIVFIGGLSDGPNTIPYVRVVAKHLENASNLDYSVFEIRMRSSFIGYGTSSLKNDVEDISALVKYLRGRGKERIVLFGHSTGCQVWVTRPTFAQKLLTDVRIAWNTQTTTRIIRSRSKVSSSRPPFRTGTFWLPRRPTGRSAWRRPSG